MKLRKTGREASIYLLTFLILGLGLLSGCAERQTSEQETIPTIDVNGTFVSLSESLAAEKTEILPNGTISRSTWKYEYGDCVLTIKEEIAYKRMTPPYGGFNDNAFLTAWESTRTLALSQVDPSLVKANGPHIKIHTLEHKNLIKEENRYTEAYLKYYQAENGTAHPANSDFNYNLITIFAKDEMANAATTEYLKTLLTHCQSR